MNVNPAFANDSASQPEAPGVFYQDNARQWHALADCAPDAVEDVSSPIFITFVAGLCKAARTGALGVPAETVVLRIARGRAIFDETPLALPNAPKGARLVGRSPWATVYAQTDGTVLFDAVWDDYEVIRATFERATGNKTSWPDPAAVRDADLKAAADAYASKVMPIHDDAAARATAMMGLAQTHPDFLLWLAAGAKQSTRGPFVTLVTKAAETIFQDNARDYAEMSLQTARYFIQRRGEQNTYALSSALQIKNQ